MTSEIRNHLGQYTVLMAWLTLGILGLAYWRYNPQVQLQITMIILTGYMIWGWIHHYREGDLNTKIMLEYGLVAGIALALVWAVLMMA